MNKTSTQIISYGTVKNINHYTNLPPTHLTQLIILTNKFAIHLLSRMTLGNSKPKHFQHSDYFYASSFKLFHKERSELFFLF